MAKPKLPNQKKAYKSLEKRLIQYVASVRAIYEELNKEASQIALRTDYDPTGEKPFRWADFPQTTKAIKSLQSSFVQKMETLIISGISAEWMASNRFCDLLADKVMKAYGAKGKKKYYQVNNDAKKAFIARKDRGMNLSQKLWNQSAEYKAGLEHTLSVAIEKGMSAVTLSKRVSKYLNDFDTMKADYGKRFGKATNIYDCEYRSIRLARSEINMAYRNAEQLRWSQMDFIIGYEVKLSDNHNCKGVPIGAFYDICDDLKGRYPKDFKWSGWHPNCRCYVIAIIKSEERFWEDEDKRGNDNETITEMPENFNKWASLNQDRIARAEQRGTLPYFVRDNRERVKQAVKQGDGLIIKEGGMKGGAKGGHLGRKEEHEAYVAYNKKGNSVTKLSEEQKQNRNQLAEMLGIRNDEIQDFMTHEQADGQEPNTDYRKGGVYRFNCQSCVVAYEARRRGLNVTALGYDSTKGSPSELLSNDCSLAFQNANVRIVNPKGKQLSQKMIDDATKNQGRYFFGWDKKGGDGHIIIAERMKDNTLVFYDPQDGQYWNVNEIFTNAINAKVTSMRVDTLQFNNDLVRNLMRMS